MTHETKQASKKEIFASFREKAVSEFKKYLPEDAVIDDSWEGVMAAVDYILDHADRKGERSGAILAAAMWMHGFLEEETYCRLHKLAEIVESEVAASREGKTATPAPAVSHAAPAAKAG